MGSGSRIAFGVAAVVAVALLTLSACSTPAHTSPADIEGNWTSTRTLTSTTVANDALKVGDTVVRNVVISKVACKTADACTGTITSTAPDASTAPASTTLTFDGTALAYAFDPDVSDCTFTDGTVASPKAYTLTVDYTLTVSKSAKNSVSEFTGTSGNTVTESAAAATVGCPAGGDREFDVVLTRTP